MLALVGETACFAANALSYLAAIGSLLALHPHATGQQRHGGRLREAYDYLKRFAPARWMLINPVLVVRGFLPGAGKALGGSRCARGGRK